METNDYATQEDVTNVFQRSSRYWSNKQRSASPRPEVAA